MKYSYPDMTRLQEFMLINQETFSVLVGPDHLFQAVVAAGGDGVVSGNAMVLAEHYREIWKALQAGEWDVARKIQRRTNVLNRILCEKNNISAYKVMLREKGILRFAAVRAPLENLSVEEERDLIERMRELDYTKAVG